MTDFRTDFRALCAELVETFIHSPGPGFLAALNRARAALAQPEPEGPPSGEVAELVVDLRQAIEGVTAMGWDHDADAITRAADLLEQLIPPQPVSVADRLPGVSDTRYEFSVFDSDYGEQAGGTAPTYAEALREGEHYLVQYQQDGTHTLEIRRVDVLHPGALPLPSGEVSA